MVTFRQNVLIQIHMSETDSSLNESLKKHQVGSGYPTGLLGKNSHPRIFKAFPVEAHATVRVS